MTFRSVCLLLFVLTAIPPLGGTDWQKPGNVRDVKSLPTGVELKLDSGTARVAAVDDLTIRVRFSPSGQFAEIPSWAVVPRAEPPPKVNVNNSSDAVEISTAAARVRIEKAPLRITFMHRSGHVLSEDAEEGGLEWDGEKIRIRKKMPADEHYYGLGDKSGSFDHRGHSYTLWNTDAYSWGESTDPLYKSIPFFLALRHGISYGIFFDNTYRSQFDFGKEEPGIYSFGADGGELDYYFFAGLEPKKVLEEYSALTGRVPLPPLWALGFQQSRYSYYPETRVREIAKNFRERNIPADVIYLDIDYMEGYRPFTISRTNFPDFEKLVADLRRDGFHVITILDPGIKKERGYSVYDTGLARDVFVHNLNGSLFEGRVWPGMCVFPDFASSDVRRWWGSLYSDLAAKGVSGFWNDMNEPAILGAPGRPATTMPSDALHHADGVTLPHSAFHNVYGMQMARATFEGLRALRSYERPFVLTRAAFSGTQRYAASWTGDNSSTWEHLRLSVRTLLNLGLSGYAFVGDDIGGYAGAPTPDLLTRWIELGSFNPLDRDHTEKGTADQEPWVHGEPHVSIRRRYIELRYRLLPYLYTALEESSRTGVPLMRPLILEYPADEKFYGNDREFLFGRDFLVAPKLSGDTNPVEVILPQGDWYEYETGKRIRGGQTLEVATPLDALPLYVRAGALVPEDPLVQSTFGTPQGPLELRVYPGPECSDSLYQDDGHSYNYTRGKFLRTTFTCIESAGVVRLHASASNGDYRPWWKEIAVTAFGIEKRPRRVQLGRRRLAGWNYDTAARSMTVRVPQNSSGWDLTILY